MSTTPPTPRPRPGLPLWVKFILVAGALAAVLGLVLAVVPIVALFWLMGSGDQVDTRALASSSSLAVFHLEPDPEDPGVAAMLEYFSTTLPEVQSRLRQAQGYPLWMAQLESIRNARNAQAGVATMMPTQATLTLEPGDDVDAPLSDATMMGAVNLPSWGRAARLGMWFGARLQDQLAEADPSVRATQRLEVQDHTLYVQSGSGEEVFWGAIDSTLLGGAGGHPAMVGGMERMHHGTVEPLAPMLSAAVELLGGSGFEAWGAMVLDAAVVDEIWAEPDYGSELDVEQARMLEEVLDGMLEQGGGEIPEGFEPTVDASAEAPSFQRTCLAELPGGQALSVGLDLQSADAVLGRMAVVVGSEADRAAAQACLEEVCAEVQETIAESQLSLECSYEQTALGVVLSGQLSGMEAAMEAFLEEMDAELQRQQDEAQQYQLPPEYQDLPDLEGLEF